uniref:Uncharacterized protein n=1 Tax=Tanacetum cinerariifolium TaxID=118510 RepID=A0A699GHM3_TANCI|nr:hypothetical protein [Tanacetum cinerariifolium]
MLTQQDIYAVCSENHPPMLNKDNYVPWSSGEPDLPVPVHESFHKQIDEELTKTDIKRMDADDQAIQTILLGLPEDVYVVVDSFETAKEIWERMNQEEVNKLRAECLAKSHDTLALMAHSQNSFNFPITHKDQSSSSTHPQQSFPINNKYNPQPSLNQNFMQPPMTSLEDINGPTEAINAALILFAKAFQLSAPTNNNQRTSSNPRNRQLAQLVMNMGQDRQIQNNGRIQGAQNAGVKSGGNQNGLVVVPGIANQSRTGNVVTARAESSQASTSGTQHDRAPIYDTDGSAENDNHVTSVAPSMVQSGGTVETSSAPNEDIRVHQETVYRNLVDQVAQVDMVNCNMRATNAKLKFELPRYKIQEQRVEISQEKYDKLEKCYQKSVYQEQCLTRKINALHLSFAKQITTLNDEISNLNKQLSKEKSSISSLMEEKKKLKNDFKIQEDKFLDKEVNLEARIKDLENILLKRDQTLRDLKGKSSNTPSASNTLDPLNQKLESKIVELEFQVVNYERKISHLKTTYKNLFDSIKSNQAHAKLHDLIFENAKLRARLFKNTSESVKNTSGTSVIPHVDKPKLSAVTPHSKKFHASTHASIRTNPITNSQRHVIVKENMSSNMATASFIGLVHTARTRRPYLKGNTKNARIPSASKSSKVKKVVTLEDHRRTLLLSKNQKTMSSECNNIKFAIRNDKSKIVCDTCKQCLVTANHDACLTPSINVLNSRANKLCNNVPLSASRKRHMTQVWKPKQVGSKERLANKPRRPRLSLKWSPSGRSFDQKGKLVASKETNFPNDDKACCPNLSVVRRLRLFQAYDREHQASHQLCVEVFGNCTLWERPPCCYFGIFGQFCDADLEFAFRRNTCFIRDLDGVDMLKGNHSTNLYTINLHEMASASPICLMARATPTKSWLWHQRLSHLNFNTINDLAKNDLVSGLPKFKYAKEHLYPSCEQGKSKRASHPPKPVLNLKQQLHLLYMDLCGPIVGITHETSAAKTPQQNGVVERRNRMLVEAARTMLIFSYATLFLWAEAIATNDREDIGKLGTKGDIGFFIGYSANYVAYIVYNRRTRKIMETMNVTFNELSAMSFEQNSFKTRTLKPSERDLDILFELLHNEYLGGRPTEAPRAILAAPVLQNLQAPTASMSFQDFAPVPTNSSNTPVSSHNVDVTSQQHAHQQRNLTLSTSASTTDNVPNAGFEGELFVNPFGTPSTDILEPKTVKEALTDPAWIESMQEELHQFIRLDVWELVPSPDGIKPLTLKWLFKNKHDEENTVIRNKTRLVMEAIRIFLAYATHKGFTALYGLKQSLRAWYDELSTFLLQNGFSKGTIDPTLFTRRCDDDILVVNQSPSGIFINQSKYVHEILKKYGLNISDIIGTPMDIKDKLDLVQIGTPVDATKYRSMIGALMYLTSSRPDIVHATCVCARYQAHPTKKHLKEVKRIFRYLWGTVNMGLCQNRRDVPKDTPIDRLEVLRYDTGKKSKVRTGIMLTEIEPTLEQTQQVTMEILLEPTLNKLLVGAVGDSIWIELVTLDIDLGPE